MIRPFRFFKSGALALLALFLALPAQAAYTDNNDGTVTDTVTGLMWDKCSWGQSNDTDCSGGAASTHTWAAALGVAVSANSASYKGHNDWRLPNRNELESLVKIDASSPAIDAVAFPNTMSGLFDWYWTSTNYASDPAVAWFVGFYDGYTNSDYKAVNYLVRLVRSGQSFDSFDAQGDFTPDAFSFTAQTGAALSSVATSNTITVAGINSAANIGIADGTYSVNGGGYTAAAGAVNSGDTVTVQQTSSGSYNTMTTATLTIGGVAGAFDVTTLAQDTTPTAFTFTAQTGAALSSVATSNTITVAGINSAANISIAGGTYSVNGGGYTAVAGTVNNGDTVTVKQTSSGSYSTTTTATLTIGGVAGAFNVTTVAAPVVASPVNGVCGTANGVAASSAPSANRCATGPSSAVAGSGPWAWSCYGSDGGSNASCSAPLALLNQTVSFGAAPSITVGGSGTVSATATSGLAVGFTSTTTGICTVSGSTVTGVAAGTCTVAADQAGNASYNPAPQATQNITVGKNSQTISFGAVSSITVGDTGTATATATSGLAVGFTSTTTGICTVRGSTVTGVAAGTCTIAANHAGSASYNPAPQVTQSITVTQAPVNGACGSANGIASAFAPNSNLCTAGTASAVTAGSPWSWACNGSGGGTNANCSAPNQTTGSGGSSGGRAVVSGGTWVVDLAQSSGFVPTNGHAKSPPGLPPGTSFPYGLLDFVLNTGATGTAATITITYPTALPAGAVYWKYGPSPAGYNCSGGACAAPHWYQMPAAQAVFAGDTITLTISDGGVGDDDLAANGVIVDQGGPGVPFSTASIPTLSEWALLALAGLMGLLGMGARRRAVL